MNGNKKAKNALITGASRGIGKGIAFVMAAAGYDLSISYATQKEEAEETAHAIEQQFGRRCVVYQANLEKLEVSGELVENTIKELGTIDVLVNNAGVTFFDELMKMDEAKMDKLYHLDFKAPLMTIQAVGRHMIAQNIQGSIINITSTRAERSYPRDAVYGGLKSALTRATQSIALELAPHRIRVNCIAPGATWIRDSSEEFYEAFGPKIPLGRVGTPEDIGHAVVWISSEQAAFITGTTIRIDGGLILPGMPEDIRPEAGYGWGMIQRRSE